jgi:hypothetical protein
MHHESSVNRKALTVVFGLFNDRETVLAITRKDVGLQIRDIDIERMSGRWVAIRNTFPVRPGAYLLRIVVQDAEEHRLATATGTVEVR